MISLQGDSRTKFSFIHSARSLELNDSIIPFRVGPAEWINALCGWHSGSAYSQASPEKVGQF